MYIYICIILECNKYVKCLSGIYTRFHVSILFSEQSLHYSNASRPVISRKAEFSTGRVIKCGRRRKMPIAATSTPTLEPVTVRSLDIGKDMCPVSSTVVMKILFC